ncbi:MAG: permease prefix domain 1-containing protein [Dehalococcoidia bacterium]|nr:permease prefix domain 1-containing protein [Dehalococcoidia bacterium]
MLDEVRSLLGSVRLQLRLDPSAEQDILSEIYAHIEDRAEELQEAGLTKEEAVRIASREFGPSRKVAEELNEVHSVSDWPQAAMAALPHVLFGLLFAFKQWTNAFWLSIILISVFGAVTYGWRRNKPTWFFTWLGYALTPFLVVGLLLLDRALGASGLSSAWWLWACAVIYFSIVTAICAIILVHIWKRDWLLGSLSTLPFLAVIGWVLTDRWNGGLIHSGGFLHGLEPWIALSLLALAGIVIVFTRLKKRWLKVGVLLVAALVILTMMTAASGRNVNIANLAALIIIALAIILGPALVDRRLGPRHEDGWADFWEKRSHH